MKRLVAILCAVVAMTALLTACGKFKCDRCGVESDGAKYDVQINGEKAVVCESCKDLVNIMSDLGQSFS